MRAPARQRPQLDLNHIDQSQHQEDAPADRTRRGNQVPDPEQVFVDPGQVEGEVAAEVEGPGEAGRSGGDPDGLLEAQGDEAGEEEGAEGVDVEGDEVFGDLASGGAGGVVVWVDEAVGGVGGVPGEADEDGEGEEGIDVDDAIEGCYVYGSGEFGRWGGGVHFPAEGGEWNGVWGGEGMGTGSTRRRKA